MIGIPPKRKPLPDLPELVLLKGKRVCLVFGARMIKYRTQWVDDHGVAAMMNVMVIISDTVDAGDITLILDSPGLQQRLPGMRPPLRPVRDIKHQIIFVFGSIAHRG